MHTLWGNSLGGWLSLSWSNRARRFVGISRGNDHAFHDAQSHIVRFPRVYRVQGNLLGSAVSDLFDFLQVWVTDVSRLGWAVVVGLMADSGVGFVWGEDHQVFRYHHAR